MPWLSYLDDDRGFSSFDDHRTKKRARIFGTVQEDKLPSAEEMTLEALAAMEKARAAMAVDRPDGPVHFAAIPRGGTRHLMAAGRVQDAAQGVTKTDEATQFCVRRSLQKTFKATFSQYPSDDDAHIIVRAWCHRMSHFMRLEAVSSDDHALRFTSELIRQCVEPTELTRFADRVAGKLSARVRFIREIPVANDA